MLEEQSPQGLSDTGPMSVYQLMLSYEKRGHLDLKITGHAIDRPANVRRGEAANCIEVAHEAHSVFKPNAVPPNNVKGTNIAGLIGNKVLGASEYLDLVWRLLVSQSICSFSLVQVNLKIKIKILNIFSLDVKSIYLFRIVRNAALFPRENAWPCQAPVVCQGQHCFGCQDGLPDRLTVMTMSFLGHS